VHTSIRHANRQNNSTPHYEYSEKPTTVRAPRATLLARNGGVSVAHAAFTELLKEAALRGSIGAAALSREAQDSGLEERDIAATMR